MLTTIKTFPLFNAFPKDIRLLIWEFSLPEPRIVHVRQAETSIGRVEHDGYYVPAWVMRSYCPLPSILHVNTEAREIASRFYTPAFRCSFPISKDAPYIWFDFDRDIFYLTKETFHAIHGCFEYSASNGIKDLPPADICRVKNLAISSKNWRYRAQLTWLSNILQILGGVENLTICTSQVLSVIHWSRGNKAAVWDLRTWDADEDAQIDVRRCIKKYDPEQDSLHPRLALGKVPCVEYSKIYLEDLRDEMDDIDLHHETITSLEAGNGGLIVDEIPIDTPENHHAKQQEAATDEKAGNDDENAWEDYNPFPDYIAQKRIAARFPKIQYKVFLSARLKEALERARNEYHLRIQRNLESHKKHDFLQCQCRRRPPGQRA
ncbi:hypothetical protein ACMFMG_003721 [Clarireedia jacksonii]